jgi:small multidrug resistance pump
VRSYFYLMIAIAAEVVATSALKRTEQFTRLIPSLVVAVGYLVAFYFLTLVLDTISVGVTYAMWSGLGIVLVTVVGAVLYGEVPDLPAIVGMTLIVAGVLVMNLFSGTVSH